MLLFPRTSGLRSQPPRGRQLLDSMADVVERLHAEFESALEMATVVRVVRSCQRELAISGSSSPDMLHARARGRLRALVTIKQITADPLDHRTRTAARQLSS